MITQPPVHLEGYPPLPTERMCLVPLSLAQMQLQLDDYAALERSLGAKVTGNRLDNEMRAIVARSMAYMRQEAEDAVWNTFWAAVLEDEAIFVGGIGFKGPPNGDGEVEVGYGFDAPYRNRGLATEAVVALTEWAFAQPDVYFVIAETNYTNVASARVLQKAGFLLYASKNHFLYWRKDKHGVQPSLVGETMVDGHGDMATGLRKDLRNCCKKPLYKWYFSSDTDEG